MLSVKSGFIWLFYLCIFFLTLFVLLVTSLPKMFSDDQNSYYFLADHVTVSYSLIFKSHLGTDLKSYMG